MKEAVIKLNEELDRLKEVKLKTEASIEKTKSAIKALQDICDHNGGAAMEYESHDSHHDYYKCSLCGKGKKD